jgi:hypothetical protein
MLMIVTGAGASFDSDRRRLFTGPEVASYRLPLARELFADRFGQFVAQNPASQALIGRLRAASTVELELEAIRLEANEYDVLRRQLAAIRFYLRDLVRSCEINWLQQQPDQITNYIDLLSSLERWRADHDERLIFVTFNYDTLVERAVQSFYGFPHQRVDDLVGSDRCSIIKLHGSIDWLQRISNEWPSAPVGEYDLTQFLVDKVDEWAFTDTYFSLQEGGAVTPTTAAVPAISIPMQTKTDSDFACPPSHLEVLRNALPDVTQLLVIGWRGQEDHFHQLWRDVGQSEEGVRADRSPGSLLCVHVVDVDRAAADAVEAQMTSGMRLKGVPFFLWEGGFSRFVENDLTRYIRHLG